jgi:RHS repeat-associated protein
LENTSYKTKASKQYTYSTNSSVGPTGTSGYGNGEDIVYHPYWQNLNLTKRLTSITTNDETVTFNANTARLDLAGNRLDNIVISNSSFCTQFNLSYDYMEDNNYTQYDYSRRLQLNSVQELSCDFTVSKPPYTFEYTGDLVNGKIFLPHRLSNQIDHWGFYNGKTANENNEVNVPSTTALIGFTNSPLTYGSSNREVDSIFSVKGTIKKIKYPTGGSTSFEFSPNDYSHQYADTTYTNATCNTCGTPSPACCGALTNSVNVTFPNSSSVSSATFDAQLVFNPVNYPNNCSGTNGVSATISAWNGATQIGSNYSFSLGSAQTSGGITSIPISNFGSFMPNVQYTFKITSNNGRGELKVKYYSVNFITASKLGPGLRIRKIIKNDNVSVANDVIYNYNYNQLNSTVSSATLPAYDPQYITQYSVIPYIYDGPDANDYLLSDGQTTTWSDATVMPLTDFTGNIIVYGRVTESITGNGRKVMTYNTTPPSPIQNNLPSCLGSQIIDVSCTRGCYLPLNYNGVRGKISSETVYNESGGILAQTNYTYINENFQENSIMFKHRKFICQLFSNGGAMINGIYRSAYKLNSCRTLTSSVETIKDGVSAIQNFTYDPLKQHSMPVTESITNSDGKVYLTENYYIHSYFANNTIRDFLKARNIIGSPWRTVKKVNGTVIDDIDHIYAFHNLGTGAYQGTTIVGGFVRYSQTYRSEYTFNTSGTPITTGRQLQNTVGYDSYGNISSYERVGWQPITYEWFANGAMKKTNFQNHIKEYTYYAGTRLINTVTDIDGQVKTYEYDKLRRLNKIRERSNNVITDVAYHFQEPSDLYNWMRVTKTNTPTSGSALNTIEVKNYIDGLGRPLQTVKKGHANGTLDLVTDAVEYDNKGRVIKNFLPFQSSFSTGQFAAIPANQKFTLVGYEPSPLNRPISQTPPDWVTSTISYGANIANDVKATYGSSPTYFSANKLYRETSTDASGRISVKFTDILGRAVLNRSTKTGATAFEIADTYMDYDLKSRLKNVFPPNTNTTTTGLIFSYIYDEGDNMTQKKVPDQAAVDMVYNGRDLMTYSRDGNLGNSTYNENGASQWMMTKYDIMGRPISTGFLTAATPPNIESDAVAFTKQISSTTYGTAGIEKGKVKQTNSLILGNYASSGQYLSSINTYDAYGRVASVNGNNHLNVNLGSQTSAITYDFADNVLTETTASSNGSLTYSIANRMTYDFLGRPIETYHKINTNPEMNIARNTYNFRGEVVNKSLGISGANKLQNIDFSYNAQGWLTNINDPFSITVPEANDVFRLQLGYNSAPMPVKGLTAALDLSGNISQMTYQNKGMEPSGYNFNYDFLGRMTGSKYYDLASATAPSCFDGIQNGTETSIDCGGSCGACPLANISANLSILFDNYASEVSWNIKNVSNVVVASSSGYTSAQNGTTLNIPLSLAPGLYTFTIFDSANDGLCCNYGQGAYTITYNGATLASGGQYTTSESKVLNFTATYNQKYDEDLTYDIRGNILTLQRKTANGAGMTPIDNLSYSYNAGTNRLSTISDASSNAAGFNVNGATLGYGYDLNGNYFTDPYKKITSSKYYFNNLPKDIVVSGGANNGTIRFTYDASGMKLRKEVFNTSNVSQRKQDYIGRIEYVNNVVEAIYTSEGRAVWVPATSTWRYEYNITDHLGNVRAVISDLNNNSLLDIASGEIINQNAYYPFGMLMNNSALANNTSTPDTKYQYNGKEFNADLGLNLLDYGARWYDPSIGRFGTVDPLAEKMPGYSPYNYVLNNPIRLIDPDGRAPEDANGGDNPIVGFLKASVAYGAGVLNAVGSNSLLGAGRRDPSEFGEYSSYAQAGQTTGDVISVVQGGAEMIFGAGSSVAVSATGVGVLATPATAAVGVHGATTTATAMSNLLNPSRVEAKSSNTKTTNRTATEHTSNARNSTKQKHEDNQARQAKEQAAADKNYSATKSTKVEKTNNQKKRENPNYFRKGPKE